MGWEVIGYVGAIFMGLSLGLIGGGGSILTVPILVYLFHVDVVLATAYSLFIVGTVSLIGSFSHMRFGNIDWSMALVFGLPSIMAVFATRAYLVPALPDPLFSVGTMDLSKSLGLLLLFAGLMVVAAYSMIRKVRIDPGEEPKKRTLNIPLITAEGLVVGTITGLVGAGGGFLIIPALVLFAGLSMKRAVGTSLLIIASKSLIGFTGDLGEGTTMDWGFLMLFSAVAIVGIIAGSMLSKRISNERLKPAFGWFVLVMGVYIIGRELTHLA